MISFTQSSAGSFMGRSRRSAEWKTDHAWHSPGRIEERGVRLFLCMVGDNSWTGRGATCVFVCLSLASIEIAFKISKQVVLALRLSAKTAITAEESCSVTLNYCSRPPTQPNQTWRGDFPPETSQSTDQGKM